MKHFAKILTLAAISAGAMFPQGPGGPMDPAAMVDRRVEMMTEQLGLKKDQQAKAKAIYTDEMSQTRELMRSSMEARQSLQDAIKANDAAAMEKYSQEIGKISAQTTLISAKSQAQLYQTLTADQKGKFDNMRGMGMGMMGGPGGFGGGRPGGQGGRQRPPQQ